VGSTMNGCPSGGLAGRIGTDNEMKE
jgi:hypothetical protein